MPGVQVRTRATMSAVSHRVQVPEAGSKRACSLFTTLDSGAQVSIACCQILPKNPNFTIIPVRHEAKEFTDME
jgi:hypothetical protein